MQHSLEVSSLLQPYLTATSEALSIVAGVLCVCPQCMYDSLYGIKCEDVMCFQT